tara:strand:+ start:215676 stop:216029 length:354 start_codon:yes stop_codon:yes gene_type:complete
MSRLITVKKKDLIAKIKENKANHIVEYDQAVIDYKVEALRQLNEQIGDVTEGGLEAKLDLVTPINNAHKYDEVVEMFDWEVKKEVTLEQHEFQKYVQDQTEFARSAKFSNTFYSSTH